MFQWFKDRWMYRYAEVLRLSGKYKDGDEPWDVIRHIEDKGDGWFVIHTGGGGCSWRATLGFRVRGDYIADIAVPQKEVYDAEGKTWRRVEPDSELYLEFDELIHAVAIPELIAVPRSH